MVYWMLDIKLLSKLKTMLVWQFVTTITFLYILNAFDLGLTLYGIDSAIAHAR